ncbi:MAG: TetR/AcrR family transcriptional regulator [Pseudomonadota bacterium]|nr:TetR/AcrR family transcriptional regulator [Pseudomonadota bacterium]
MAAVMAEAGLTHGGSYAHFESKDDLIASAIGRMFDEAAQRLVASVAGQSPAAALRSYIEFDLSAAGRSGHRLPHAGARARAAANRSSGATTVLRQLADQLQNNEASTTRGGWGVAAGGVDRRVVTGTRRDGFAALGEDSGSVPAVAACPARIGVQLRPVRIQSGARSETVQVTQG